MKLKWDLSCLYLIDDDGAEDDDAFDDVDHLRAELFYEQPVVEHADEERAEESLEDVNKYVVPEEAKAHQVTIVDMKETLRPELLDIDLTEMEEGQWEKIFLRSWLRE